MLKKLKSCIILVILLLSLIYTLTNTQTITNEILTSLNIFITKLFPNLFFFFLLGDLLVNYKFVTILKKIFEPLLKFIFHIGGNSSFVIIMSIFSGFPSGSKYICSLVEKKCINENTANYLLTFTHFSNPVFILGTIAQILNRRMATRILIAHYLANFIVALIIRPKKIETEPQLNLNTTDFTTCLSNSIKNTTKILLFILGNSIFFNCISSIITTNINNNIITTIINGFFDITKGIISTNTINCTIVFKSILITTFLSFGGINVHLQVKNIIKEKRKLKYKNFLLGRISQTALSLIILLFIC